MNIFCRALSCLTHFFFEEYSSRRQSGSLLRTGALSLLILTASSTIWAQTALLANGAGRTLANHVPHWADPNHVAAIVPPQQRLDTMTIVLSRSPKQEQAFEQFLADQQNPAARNYHRWLTAPEIGVRFGPSSEEVAGVTDWLRSQGLQVEWVSQSRSLISFSGTAATVGNAFQTQMLYYTVNGVRRMAPASAPVVPAYVANSIKAIRGLYTVEEQPLHFAKPTMNASNGSHFIAPADFAAIYNLQGNLNGLGVTIGIVGRSRTDFADFDNFRQRTLTGFPNPTEIVPTALGGIDPGPALTSPPAQGVMFEDQLEATLDVLRAGSVAPGAETLLVVATAASGGIGVSAAYLVETTPVPVQVMSVSFGACEVSNPNGVQFWDSIFKQAAAEGISVFVASGDSGASGCDPYFASPPANPLPNSPNYICSSSYSTCVGGTQFIDTTSPSTYWNGTNSSGLVSALGYMPEGAWNEPLNATTTQAASSGGGVSAVIATPSWQTGTGVPSARTGRYTPDISFSASGHDGYFGCMAAAGADCVVGSNGGYRFEYFYGTSAAAPSAAGIAALLVQQQGSAQGNLNPELYNLASVPYLVFHDVTVATSGVTSCSLSTPSTCNNSLPGPTGLSGGQAGFLVGPGYDAVTGLGSLNVSSFLSNYMSVHASPAIVSAVSGGGQTAVYGSTFATPLSVSVTDLNGKGIPGIPVTFSGAGLAFQGNPALTGSNGQATISVVAASVNSNLTATATVSGVASPASFALAATPAKLIVAATSSSIVISQPIPSLAYNISGFVNGDSGSVVTGTPVEATTATQNSPVGFYPITITQGSLAATNYSFTFVNGTLSITSSAMGLQFVPATPCRIADTRGPAGPFQGPMLAAGTTREFDIPRGSCGIPSEAVAYSLNVTVVPSGSLNYLTMWPTGLTQPYVSTLNSDGRLKANAAITPAGTNGGVNIFVSDATNVILDIDGYFLPAGAASALAFYPLTPCRVSDTRSAAGPLGGPFIAGNTHRDFPVQSSTCGIPSNAQAYSVNVTAAPHSTLNYLTAWSTGQPQPYVSTLNSSTGAVTANAAIIPAASNGDVSIFVSDDADVILDVNGYFAAPGTGGLSLYTTTPCRIVDSRGANGAFNGVLSVAAQASVCAPPSVAQAYVLNATVVPSGSLNYLTLWPNGQSQPNVSTLNARDGAITSNMAIVPNVNGITDVFSSDPTNVILDISSYFAP